MNHQVRETPKPRRTVSPLLTIVVWVTLACFALSLLDSDESTSGRLIDWDFVLVLILYGIPASCMCFLLYKKFTYRRFSFGSIAVALIIGIPLSFAFIIAVLEALKHFKFV
jgi:hypothetical protein